MPSREFDFSDGWQRFEVPKDVEILDVVLTGGGSASRPAGRVEGRLRVRPSDTLLLMVGRRGRQRDGRSGGTPVFGGGGAGGDGSEGGLGGHGGGGASAIRMNSTDGTIKAVAGGAGGNSGDGGAGGQGGASVGAIGGRGNAGTGNTGAPTGGSQSQRGQGGTSGAGSAYNGKDGEAQKLGRGGKGGAPAVNSVHGGGGGGGGYYPGGGGAAAAIGSHPGTGGAGGSNFTGGLFSSQSQQGNGGDGDGKIRISWIDPNDPNKPPVPPDNITIDGKQIASGLATKAKNSVTLRGTPDDPNAGQGVRMVVWLSKSSTFTNWRTFRGDYNATEKRDVVQITGLEQNTRYYLRIYTQDGQGRLSTNYRTTNFWTNRLPLEPTLTQPDENSQVDALTNITFVWNHREDDPNDGQSAYKFRYRRAQTPLLDAGEWTVVGQESGIVTTEEQRVVSSGVFKGNTAYEWSVRTRDQQNAWGPWAAPSSFYVLADTSPPVLVSPKGDEGAVAADPITFRWKFKSPEQETLQVRADLRYRAIGGDGEWQTVFGTVETPGALSLWTLPGETFEVGVNYEWAVRTYSSGSQVSDWSDPERFWTTAAPGSGAGIDPIPSGRPQDPLGIGSYRVYVYDRGGMVRRWEVTGYAQLVWGRRRDDISGATITIKELDTEQIRALRLTHTWMNEMVVFRNGKRVWEGPITRISGSRSSMEIEAKDVMAYAYRRIMRQGYTDAYQLVNGEQLGLSTVVQRSSQILLNCLSYDDPNVLAYLTPIHNQGDAKNSRIVKDYTRMAWEEIDDLAATAGLDYTTAGRRIILWDTHRPIGRLPEMRNGDFSDEVVVTEYGMSAANVFGVTNTSGSYGLATRGLAADGDPGPTGFIEQLASSYDEGTATGGVRTESRSGAQALSASLSAQADRNIAARWPPPIVVRVPDNATLNPDLNLDINQLVPGVWIPVRVTDSFRDVAQWQKLDSVTVTVTSEGEKIAVVMSPAPNAGEDPDAESVAEEG